MFYKELLKIIINYHRLKLIFHDKLELNIKMKQRMHKSKILSYFDQLFLNLKKKNNAGLVLE